MAMVLAARRARSAFWIGLRTFEGMTFPEPAAGIVTVTYPLQFVVVDSK